MTTRAASAVDVRQDSANASPLALLAAAARSEAVQVGSLLAVALLLRLSFHAHAPAFVGKDSQSYFLPGWELARSQPFEIGQRRTPGYPLFIAGALLALGELAFVGNFRMLAAARNSIWEASIRASTIF